MNTGVLFAIALAGTFAIFVLAVALGMFQLVFPPPSYGDVVFRRKGPVSGPPVEPQPDQLWRGRGGGGLVEAATRFVHTFAPRQTLDYLRPRLQAAGIRISPELAVGEAIIATISVAIVLTVVAIGFDLPRIIVLLALGVPFAGWYQVASRLAAVREDVDSEVASVLIVAASVARATTGLEGPRGLLPYLIAEIDCTFCDLLHEAVIEASARGALIEDVLEEMAPIYGLPVLVTVANAFRSWRRQGVALGRVMASAATAIMEAQLGNALRKAYTRNTISVLPVALFDLPALLLLLLTPALSQLTSAHGLFGR